MRHTPDLTITLLFVVPEAKESDVLKTKIRSSRGH